MNAFLYVNFIFLDGIVRMTEVILIHLEENLYISVHVRT